MNNSTTSFNYCNNSSYKNTLGKIALVSIFMTLPLFTFAKDFPLASVTDHTKGDGFAQSIGINLEYSPVFDGSDEYGIEFQVAGAIQFRKGNHLFFLEGFNIDGLELGWRSMVTNNYFLQLGIRHETVLPKMDLTDGKIVGIPHRGSTVFGFAEGTYFFDKNELFWMTGRFSAGPSDFGYRAKVSVGHSFIRSYNGLGLDLVAYSTFGDKEQFDRYFGISADESLSSGLAQSDLDGGYRSSGLEVFYRQNIFTSIQILARVGVELYSDEIEESALVSDNSELTSGFAVMWRF
ncbi:MAG: MipA/OmpV family protein [Paraglaciecola sp.]|uniref:MipA/OmpV family protein n=1 Tax=Paraglaciecola sp. TaxID=1920173 RepID=UPI003299482C